MLTSDRKSDLLQSIVRQIVAGFHPQKIILFGSHAYGAPREDSDLDLLVVMDAGGRPLRAAARIASAIDHPLPIDILVLEPRQLESALDDHFTFATEVVTRGTVLYEA